MIENKLLAGVNWSWLYTVSADYPGFNYEYVLIGPSKITLQAQINGRELAVDVVATTTKDYTAGLYKWALYAYQGNDRHLINHGNVEIEADILSLGAGHDVRSHNQKMLDAIKSVLAGRVVKDVESYTIDDRTLNRIPIVELERLKSKYARLVSREKGRGKRPRTVRVRLK